MPTDRPLAPQGGSFASALGAHALVAVALIISFGHDNDVADLLVVASIVAVVAGVWATRERGGRWADPETLAWGVALASTVSLVATRPGMYLTPNAPALPLAVLGFAATCIVATYAVDLAWGAPPAFVERARPFALLAVAFGLSTWLLRASPAPAIDVWVVHQQGARAFLHGQQVYAPGAVSTLDTHSFARNIETYAYPPLNLVLTAVGYAVTGETRTAQLAAILGGGFLVRQLAQRSLAPRVSVLPDLLMAALLFHPRGLFVLEQAWGEPLAIPLLAGFALAASTGHMRFAAVLLGLLAALKQHLVLYVPALVLVPGIGLSGGAIALGTLVLTYLPFVATAPGGVWRAVVVHHLENPFRGDSLSLSAMLAGTRAQLPPWLGFAAAGASFGALLAVPRRLGPLLLASTLPFTLFYALGRQAFCNYYYLLGATWICAAAALLGRGI